MCGQKSFLKFLLELHEINYQLIKQQPFFQINKIKGSEVINGQFKRKGHVEISCSKTLSLIVFGETGK